MTSKTWTTIKDIGTDIATTPDDAHVYFISDAPLPKNKGPTLMYYSNALGASQTFDDE
jgi:hypothetical protein